MRQLDRGMLKINDGWRWLDEWDVEGTIIEYHIKKAGIPQVTKQVRLKWADPLAPLPADRPHSHELGRAERVNVRPDYPEGFGADQTLAKGWQRVTKLGEGGSH